MYANVQVPTFIKLSLENSPSLRLFQKINRPEKFPFVATNDSIVSAVRFLLNTFFRIP